MGKAHIYMSAALGATFPATYFVDHQGQPVTPGTFWADFNSQKGAYTLLLGEAGG